MLSVEIIRGLLMRLLMVVAGLAIGLSAATVRAQTPDLAPVATQLEKIRHSHGINEQRDAGPEFTPVKQALREWVERQLPPAPGTGTSDGTTYFLDAGELTSLSARLNQGLDAAGLTCGRPDSKENRCGSDATQEDNERGYLDDVHLARLDNRYLLVVTGVGMKCGFDQSAYLYEQGSDHHWRLLIRIEQSRYGKDEYEPQHFLSIQASSSDSTRNEPSPPPLVTALGYSPWCSSNWQVLYTRLWRASRSKTTPTALIDRQDSLYMGDDFVAGAHLTSDELLVQFKSSSIDGAALVRPHILRYQIRPKHTPTRMAPVALDPRAFVDEWLTTPWTDASHWLSPSADRSAFAQLHATESHRNITGEFDGSPRRCRESKTLRQVTFNEDTDKDIVPRYFKVDWTAPYDFSLVAVSSKPFEGCDEAAAPESTLGTVREHAPGPQEGVLPGRPPTYKVVLWFPAFELASRQIEFQYLSPAYWIPFLPPSSGRKSASVARACFGNPMSQLRQKVTEEVSARNHCRYPGHLSRRRRD